MKSFFKVFVLFRYFFYGLLLITISPLRPLAFIIDEDYTKKISQNRVALTCYEQNTDMMWGGQGTITNVDQLGVWITTAGHVAKGTDHCDAEFNDESMHVAYLSKIYQKSDLAIMFVPRAYWPTHASLVSMKLEEDASDWGPVGIKLIQQRDELGVGFVLSDKIYQGTILSPYPGSLFRYAAPKDNMYLTNLYSQPGSSGGGVYNKEGNLIGLVSGGSAADPYVGLVVNILAAEEEEK